MITPNAPAQIDAALAQYDRAIAAAPADAAPLEARAQMRAATSWEAAPVLDDCRKALALRVAAGEFADGDWAKRGRDWRRQSERESEFGSRQYARCYALACFERALAEAPNDAMLWVESAQSRAEIGERARAETDFDRARELSGDNAQSWFGQAQIFHNLRQSDAAYAAYYHGLFAGERDGEWALDTATALCESGQTRPPYQQRAWLDVAIERAPDDVDLRLARALTLIAHRRYGLENDDAAEDFERAIALRPGDPQIYEIRAGLDLFRGNALVVRDYQTAARLRMERGEFPREVSAITTRAKALKNQRSSGSQASGLQAIALYGLAIEIAPDQHTLYLARAKLHCKIRGHRFENPALLDEASQDWARALALKPQLEAARRALVEDLAVSTERDSAHEQLEALLGARELLRQFGVSAPLVSAIVSAVEAKLAAIEMVTPL